MIRKVLVLLATSSIVNAACNNQCSGHGNCLVDDVCECYDNFGVGLSHDSGDCSDRICPFELAWVEQPNENGEFHTYSECAGRGVCDRSTGLCECFDGYEGKACHRTTCPNDCSGHGTCEYIQDMSYGNVWNQNTVDNQLLTDAKTFVYRGWDSQKTRGCVCDAQYGDVDCSKRMCPYGTDVLTVRDTLTFNENVHVQKIVFDVDSALYDDDNSGQTFAITFTSKLNETFTTYPINLVYPPIDHLDDPKETLRREIQLALRSLPNKVIDDCTVTVDFDTPSQPELITVKVYFTGDAVQGPQNLLEVSVRQCADGCTPKITGITQLGVAIDVVPTVYELASSSYVATDTDSNLNSYECGRRGKCDYSTGLCACFEGYTGENCNTQSTLV